MSTTVHISIVNNRLRCARSIRKYAISKELGVITNVKLQRIGLLVWHLEFDVEAK